MSKGGGGGSQTTKTEPWEGVQPYLSDVYSKAQSYSNTPTPGYFPGQTYAGFTPAQLAAQQGIQDFALQGAPQIMNPAMQAYQYGTSGSILDVANNPYVQAMAQGAAQDAFGQLDPALAGIRQGAIQSGGYGGSRQGIAEGLAIGGAADAATRAAADIYGQAYGQGLQQQLGTLGMTGDILQAGFTPYGALSTAGAEQQAMNQAAIDEAMARYNYEQQAPFNKLAQYEAILSGTAGLLGGAGTVTRPGPSGAQQLGSTIGMASTLFNPTSGLFPKALATMSDIRLKKNIKKLKTTSKGINIYSWEWKDKAYTLGENLSKTVGVIAQEVKDILPEAVVKGKDGYYRVNYSMIEGV